MYPLILTSIYCAPTSPFAALYALIHLPRARPLACAKMRSGLELSGEEERELKTHRRRAGAAQRDYIVALLSAGSFILSTNTIPPTDSSAFTIQHAHPKKLTSCWALLNQQFNVTPPPSLALCPPFRDEVDLLRRGHEHLARILFVHRKLEPQLTQDQVSERESRDRASSPSSLLRQKPRSLARSPPRKSCRVSRTLSLSSLLA